MRKEREKRAIYLCTLLLWKSSLQTVTKRDTKRDQAYGPFYMAGLHGPDILFYYKPLRANAVNQIGFGMHARPAAEFFPEVTKQEVQQAVSGCNSVSSTADL